jgi:anthranilate synthase component 2
MLGVCLGHQAIAETFGAKLRQLDQVLHGVQRSCCIVKEDSLLASIPTTFMAGRYHSWVVDRQEFPETLEVLATDEQGEIMVFRHRKLPIRAVQFHPESIMTPEGKKLIETWVQTVVKNKHNPA